eukprot:CAMPEP_0194376282 /NCGR_PEP_ID=MMETSP0174-20130528/24705_1 /TAXON_ID=216777 /ORGANISM="Proboscia alata, Strain PI-D3" /LENGTH=1046 /DNA_ID=CAMNT_0039156867 /DNA_START=85 /DNA_END=3225 /DNA_ORIENTATION=+
MMFSDGTLPASPKSNVENEPRNASIVTDLKNNGETTEVDEGIDLLREIFPELPTNELLKLHHERMNSSLLEKHDDQSKGIICAADDFSPFQQAHDSHEPLDLGTNDNLIGGVERNRLMEMERSVLEHHETEQQMTHYPASNRPVLIKNPDINSNGASLSKSTNFTRVIYRDSAVGLGMTVRERGGLIYVHALICHDGPRLYEENHGIDGIMNQDKDWCQMKRFDSSQKEEPTINEVTGEPNAKKGPAQLAGILPGDRILGVSGQAFQSSPLTMETNEVTVTNALKIAVSTIQNTADPVILHLNRFDRSLEQNTNQQPTENLSILGNLSVSNDENSSNKIIQTIVNSPISPFSTSNEEDIIREHMMNSSCDLGQIDNQNDTDIYVEPKVNKVFKNTGHPDVHPLAKALTSRGILQSKEDELAITKQFQQFTDRARQWESLTGFLLDPTSGKLRPHVHAKDLPPSDVSAALPFQYKNAQNLRPFAPSTPPINETSLLHKGNNSANVVLTPSSNSPGLFASFPNFRKNIAAERVPPSTGLLEASNDTEEIESHGLLNDKYDNEIALQPSDQGRDNFIANQRKSTKAMRYPGQSRKSEANGNLENAVFVPLAGVRKGLCVRIVNSFLDGDRTAYTIWVYDTENGVEWYAPVRYFRDFKDLRMSTLRIISSIASIPFPTMGWSGVFGSDATESESAKEIRRKQLELFLRKLCGFVYVETIHPRLADVSVHLQSFLGCEESLQKDSVSPDKIAIEVDENEHDCIQSTTLSLLKRSIQRYAFRVFLLPVFDQILRQFIDAARSRAPSMDQMIALDRRSRSALKDSAHLELEKVQDFLDQLQEVILEGCMSDLIALSGRRDFSNLGFHNKNHGIEMRDSIFNESVREQVEIEVYVPLRSIISRQLVNGYRHDDLEMQFKMQALRQRPQSSFKIKPSHRSPTDWQIVSKILNKDVGRSTLPCAKLSAIVSAAKQIFKLHAAEHSSDLGADEFLPIFIFCIVRAELERPCALSILLQSLCDQSKRIGETGYYLASFEAAISYVRDLDLAEGVTGVP